MKNSTKILIAFLAGALVGGTIFFSNTELQRGSLRDAIKTPPCTTSTSKINPKDATTPTTATTPTPPADTTPPTITSINLVNGTRDPCPNTTCTTAESNALPGGKTWKFDKNDQIVIRFNESIDPHSVNPGLENGGEVDNVSSDQTGGLVIDSLYDPAAGYFSNAIGTNIVIANIMQKFVVTTHSGYTNPYAYNANPTPSRTFYGSVKIRLSSDGKTLTIINRDDPQPPVRALETELADSHYQIFFDGFGYEAAKPFIDPQTNIGKITDAAPSHNPIRQSSLPASNLSGHW